MSNQKEKSIMDEILTAETVPAIPDAAKLDCLIYRNNCDSTDKNDSGISENDSDIKDSNLVEITRNDVTIKVWESKAKIRFRVTPETKVGISMKRIADIAMDAVLAELKKEST